MLTVSFSHCDLNSIKAGLAGAVSVVDPFLARIVGSKVGYAIGDFGDVMPPGMMVVVYASTRSWVAAHRDAVKAFRASLEESRAYIENPAHADAVKASIAKYVHLPPQAAAAIQIPTDLDPVPRPQGLAFWIENCRAQGLITGHPDPAKLIAP